MNIIIHLTKTLKNMKNIVSFETAKKLEIAGFERPSPEIGQFWYTPNGRLYHVMSTNGDDIFVKWHDGAIWSSEMVVYEEEYDNWFYAATATDLLEHEGSTCVLWYDKFKQIWECAKCNNYPDYLGETFTSNENAAEAVAEAYLSQTK